MGYMRHHAIIITGHLSEFIPPEMRIDNAHAKAKSIFRDVSPVIPSVINRYGTFLVPPDGSKAGWEEDQDGDSRREEFVEWLRSLAYEDGSSPLDWVEIQYGDDDGETRVCAHSDEDRNR